MPLNQKMAGNAQYNHYRQFFEEADTDKSGSLTLEELTAALRRNGYRENDSKIKVSVVQSFVFNNRY